MKLTSKCLLAVAVAAVSCAAMAEPPGRHALLVIEQQRGSIVQRITHEWSAELAALPAGRALTPDQLSAKLWSLRADRLLAASLAGSFATVEALMADSDAEGLADKGSFRAAQKNIGDTNADLSFTPLTPCRIADTRSGAGGILTGSVPRTIDGFAATTFAAQGGASSNCGIPANVSALVLSIVAVTPSAGGWFTIWPANAAEPLASSINYEATTIAIATGIIIPVDGANSNRFIVKAPAQVATVHFIADVVGYMKAPGNASGLDLLVNGQRALRLEPNAFSPVIVGGSPANAAPASVAGAVIAGGGASGAPGANVPGLLVTVACDNIGGCANNITDAWGAIGGGAGNQAGDGNATANDSPFATVAGGVSNLAGGSFSAVGGGRKNTASGSTSTVSGGEGNLASAQWSTISGGNSNTASGQFAAVTGGINNVASGQSAFVSGGDNVASGINSFAAGQNARADQNRCAVFGLWTTATAYTCSGVANTMRVGADHGLRVDYFTQKVDGSGNRWVFIGDGLGGSTISAWNNATLTDAGVWVNGSSSVTTKTDFAPVDARAVLKRVMDLPITTWRYKKGEEGVVHMGPMAEDFWSAFGIGYGPSTIADLDARGVAFAAIQGLNQVVQEKDARIASQSRRITSLERSVAELRKLVEALATKR